MRTTDLIQRNEVLALVGAKCIVVDRQQCSKRIIAWVEAQEQLAQFKCRAPAACNELNTRQRLQKLNEINF